MPVLYARDVPEDVVDALKERAAAREMSMFAYVVEELSRIAARPTNADVRALARIVSRVSRLAVAETNLLELNINPVFVLEEGKGAVAADALVVKA